MSTITTTPISTGIYRPLLPRTGVKSPGATTRAPALPSATTALRAVAVGYWALFWALNGLDKFLNRSDVGPFFWYGKDRAEQFAEYFTRLGLSHASIAPTLQFAGLWELLVALPLTVATVALLARPRARLGAQWLNWGLVLSGLTLLGFSAFDVVVGDRAELREHGLYLALLFVCCLWTRARNPSAVY